MHLGCNVTLRLSYSNISVLQLNSRGVRPEQIYAMLQHMLREVERKEQEVERESERQEVEREKREVEREKQQLLADALCAILQAQGGAREGKKAVVAGESRRERGKERTCTGPLIYWSPYLCFFFL